MLYGSGYTHQPININCAVFIFIYCLVLIVRRYFPHILAWQVCSWNIHMCVCVDLLVGTQTNNNIINQEFKYVFTNMFLFLNITGILTIQVSIITKCVGFTWPRFGYHPRRVIPPPGCICASHSPWNGSHTPSPQATQPGLEHTTAIQTQAFRKQCNERTCSITSIIMQACAPSLLDNYSFC